MARKVEILRCISVGRERNGLLFGGLENISITLVQKNLIVILFSQDNVICFTQNIF